MTWSPAHLAAEQEDLPRLRNLLDAGHDVEDDDGHGWTLLRHAIDAEHDSHVQTGGPLHADVTAFLLARGADPLRQYNGITVVAEAETCGHWLAAEIMRAWARRGSQDPGKDPDDRSRRRHRDNLRCSRHDEPMTVDWTHQLSGQFDLQWNLAHGPSLETLTDEEYLWEPVPGCWSIRPTGPGGRGEIEQTWPDPEPAPVTTIAWRLSHLDDQFQGV